MSRSSSPFALVACVGLFSFASIALADKPVAGTKGTCTAWEGKAVLAVEACDPKGDDWDYIGCSRVLHERVPELLCKKHGPGKYNWGFQVGDEKPPLIESVSCK
jgi:hypothetical protein